MESKYTIVITDKALFECQKQAWLNIESSVAYQNLPDDLKVLVKNSLREYSRMLQGIMWRQHHVAFTDGAMLATMINNYNEMIPSDDVKKAAIKLLSRCPCDHGPVPRNKETPGSIVPREKAAVTFKENFFKMFGHMPKQQTV